MSQNAKHIGQVFQRVAGLLTALTVLATVIFTLLGVFGVVDMRAVQTEGPALALGYVVAVGAFALSPLVAVGIVAVGLFNAIGIVAIGAGSARGIIAISGDDAGGIIAISTGGRASGLLIGIGEEARACLPWPTQAEKRWPSGAGRAGQAIKGKRYWTTCGQSEREIRQRSFNIPSRVDRFP